MQRKSTWLAEELMQAVSIAQTVIKPLKQHDYWIESATKLLAGSICIWINVIKPILPRCETSN